MVCESVESTIGFIFERNFTCVNMSLNCCAESGSPMKSMIRHRPMHDMAIFLNVTEARVFYCMDISLHELCTTQCWRRMSE